MVLQIGLPYTFRWWDIEDCSLLISRDNQATWEPLVRVWYDDNNGLDPTYTEKHSFDEGQTWDIIRFNISKEEVPLTAQYTWEVDGDPASLCFVKFIDNATNVEYIGNVFEISTSSESVPTIAPINIALAGMKNFYEFPFKAKLETSLLGEVIYKIVKGPNRLQIKDGKLEWVPLVEDKGIL